MICTSLVFFVGFKVLGFRVIQFGNVVLGFRKIENFRVSDSWFRGLGSRV